MNAFYDYMEFNPLSSSAVALWYALMHINNKTRWKETFSVAASVLRYKSGLKETSFKRARQELVEKGYIIYQSRDRNLAPIYQMISLTKMWEEELENRESTTIIEQATDTKAMMSENPSTMEGKKNQSRCTTFYKENFGKLLPEIERNIATWVDEVGEDLTLEAMKRAVERNILSWDYVKGILLDWQTKGIHSVEQAKEEQLTYQKGKQRHYSSRKGKGANEVIPNWFEERENKQIVNVNEKLTPEEIEEQRKEIERLKKEILAKRPNAGKVS